MGLRMFTKASSLINWLILHFSDGWATDDLVYKWKDVDPVQIVPGLHLPRFTLEQYKSAYCNVITNTGHQNSDSKNKNKVTIFWTIFVLQENTAVWKLS